MCSAAKEKGASAESFTLFFDPNGKLAPVFELAELNAYTGFHR